MSEVSFASLATVAGATAATLVIVQVIKMLARTSAVWTRRLVLLVAILLLTAATIILAALGDQSLNAGSWTMVIIAALVNGCVAGLGAMKMYESLAHGGLDHNVTNG